MKKKINIQFRNGLKFEYFLRDVFEVNKVTDYYTFYESEKPDFIIFGPYGNDIPPKGDYVRVGYYCENFYPDMTKCDFAFGMPLESDVKDTNYFRIQWHGFDPQQLVKVADYDAEKILASKTSFCNFLYSNTVPYREKFFKELSKYKKVDAPGKSMNNMPSIDSLYTGDLFQRKRQFISNYKFTIAFENYPYPGYQTEKLYDAMLSDSIPIYCGDRHVTNIFNSKSFIHARDYFPEKNVSIIDSLEKYSQFDFDEYRPAYFKGLEHKVSRRLKVLGKQLKLSYEFSNLKFDDLIDKIIELDKHPEKYLAYLNEPWFNNNNVSNDLLSTNSWIKIFESGFSK